MRQFKHIVRVISSVLFEHITLFATIIASVYILTKSQIDVYDNNTLLLWIIGLLGLIATAIVSEKYFKLSKIAKGIEDLQSTVKNKGLSLDELAFTRKEFEPLEMRLSQAKKITITGGSLYRLSDEYYAFFENKLEKGCQLVQITLKWDVRSAEAERLFHSNRYEVPLLLRVNQFPSYLCRSSPGGRYDAYR